MKRLTATLMAVLFTLAFSSSMAQADKIVGALKPVQEAQLDKASLANPKDANDVSSGYEHVSQARSKSGFAAAIYPYWYPKERRMNAINMKCYREIDGEVILIWRKRIHNISLSQHRTWSNKNKGAATDNPMHSGEDYMPKYGWECTNGFVDIVMNSGGEKNRIARLFGCPNLKVRFAFIDHISINRRHASLVTGCVNLWGGAVKDLKVTPKLMNLKWGGYEKRLTNIPGEKKEWLINPHVQQ